MIENIILSALFLVFIGYREFFVYKERQQMLDRIQAGDYIEYKKYESKIEAKKEIEPNRKAHNWL